MPRRRLLLVLTLVSSGLALPTAASAVTQSSVATNWPFAYEVTLCPYGGQNFTDGLTETTLSSNSANTAPTSPSSSYVTTRIESGTTGGGAACNTLTPTLALTGSAFSSGDSQDRAAWYVFRGRGVRTADVDSGSTPGVYDGQSWGQYVAAPSGNRITDVYNLGGRTVASGGGWNTYWAYADKSSSGGTTNRGSFGRLNCATSAAGGPNFTYWSASGNKFIRVGSYFDIDVRTPSLNDNIGHNLRAYFQCQRTLFSSGSSSPGSSQKEMAWTCTDRNTGTASGNTFVGCSAWDGSFTVSGESSTASPAYWPTDAQLNTTVSGCDFSAPTADCVAKAGVQYVGMRMECQSNQNTYNSGGSNTCYINSDLRKRCDYGSLLVGTTGSGSQLREYCSWEAGAWMGGIASSPESASTQGAVAGFFTVVDTVAPTAYMSVAPATAWLSTTTYDKDDLVTYGGYTWQSSADANRANTPASGSSWWTRFPCTSWYSTNCATNLPVTIQGTDSAGIASALIAYDNLSGGTTQANPSGASCAYLGAEATGTAAYGRMVPCPDAGIGSPSSASVRKLSIPIASLPSKIGVTIMGQVTDPSGQTSLTPSEARSTLKSINVDNNPPATAACTASGCTRPSDACVLQAGLPVGDSVSNGYLGGTASLSGVACDSLSGIASAAVRYKTRPSSSGASTDGAPGSAGSWPGLSAGCALSGLNGTASASFDLPAAASSCTLTSTVTSGGARQLPDGTQICFYVTGTDNAANTTTSPCTDWYTVDNTAPTPPSLVLKGCTPTASVACSDDPTASSWQTITTTATWSATATYAKDDIVSYGGSTWQSSAAANRANTPASGSSWWTRVSWGWTNAEKLLVTWPAISDGGAPITKLKLQFNPDSDGNASDAAVSGSCALVLTGTSSSGYWTTATNSDGSQVTSQSFDEDRSQACRQGSQTVKMWTQDAAGNQTTATGFSSISVNYDSNPTPQSRGQSWATDTITPSAFSVTPSGWSSSNSFAMSWTNPSPNGVTQSPIASARYRIGGGDTLSDSTCLTSGASCTVSSLLAPSEGTHPLRLWLRDQAGNEDLSQSVAGSIKLQYTDSSSCLR